MEYQDEIPRYKKKSMAKPPKKSNHKHVFVPCVIERPVDWYKKEHERCGDKKADIGSYCPICGKVGAVEDMNRWYKKLQTQHPVLGNVLRTVPTDECERELDPGTRTLPTFWSEEIFPKYVKLDNKG